MACNNPDTDGTDHCIHCGEPIGASGCDGGSWVHMSTRPDRVISTEWHYGKMVRQTLANGVIIKYKPGKEPCSVRRPVPDSYAPPREVSVRRALQNIVMGVK